MEYGDTRRREDKTSDLSLPLRYCWSPQRYCRAWGRWWSALAPWRFAVSHSEAAGLQSSLMLRNGLLATGWIMCSRGVSFHMGCSCVWLSVLGFAVLRDFHPGRAKIMSEQCRGQSLSQLFCHRPVERRIDRKPNILGKINQPLFRCCHDLEGTTARSTKACSGNPDRISQKTWKWTNPQGIQRPRARPEKHRRKQLQTAQNPHKRTYRNTKTHSFWELRTQLQQSPEKRRAREREPAGGKTQKPRNPACQPTSLPARINQLAVPAAAFSLYQYSVHY